ncbi:hypothetical protein [Hirschia litorea]|uniref:Uncharacterized protein n=1 Tax=Hirschia litorea TaxID=1199156 RepID=A0ABW2IGF5_9PROT
MFVFTNLLSHQLSNRAVGVFEMGRVSVKTIVTTATTGCLKALFLSDVAHASAWTLPKNAGYQSLNVGYERGDFGKNWRQDSYLEFGMTDDWTVTGKMETVWRAEANYNDRSSGQIGAKREIWSKDAWHMTAQSTVYVGEKLDDQSCGGFGGEFGVAAGYSQGWKNSKLYGFAEIATGARQGCEHVTVDAVVGYQPDEKWDVQVKAFSEQYPGREFAKLEVGVSRRFGKSYMGVGMRQEMSGAFEENSVFMSIWKQF